MIKIDDPLHHHLAKKNIVYIVDGIHLEEHQVTKPPDFVLPPLNTHITFLNHADPYSDEDHLDLHHSYSIATASSLSEELPDTYDWRKVYPQDDSEREKKKKHISPPDNQYLCGSCWAISTAGVIGDAFVVAGLVDWTPEISTTWALTCYSQNKCDGGNPTALLKAISRGSGIPSKHCLDYSWCVNNLNCNGQAVKHFMVKNLSSLVPGQCGCYYGGSKVRHYMYSIDKKVRVVAIDNGATTTANLRDTVRKHIYTRGPVLVGYFVMKNFSSGYFTEINGGVYFERANYVPGSTLTFSDSEVGGYNYKGSHAVAIIGWGVAKNILYDNDKRGDVPYWYCRNSWGSKWGADNGYFKMAMYPYNKLSQFGKIVDIVDGQNQTHRCGGIITFTVSEPPKKAVLQSLTSAPSSLLRDKNYYTQDEDMVIKDPPESNLFVLQWTMIAVSVFLFVFLTKQLYRGS
jgi:hypothetical protein